MKPKWNPTIKTLVRNLEFIERYSPCPMNRIPYSKVSYKWYWVFRDLSYFEVTRSKDDGRCHLVNLTDAGKELLIILKNIENAGHLPCHRCGILIDRFFKVSDSEWKRVTGDEHDQVICKSCFEKMKAKDPEEMRTVEDVKKIHELGDGIALNEYGIAFHKLSKQKQERVEKLAEKIFYGEK